MAVNMEAARQQLNLLTVMELRSLCLKHGISVRGRKLELIGRIIDRRAMAEAAATNGSAGTAAETGGGSVVPGNPTGQPGRGPPPNGPALRSRTRARPAGGARGRHGRGAAKLDGDVGAGDRAAGSPAASRSRPLRCAHCTAAFDPQGIQYTKDPDSFWCPPCRFKVMDPFNPVVEAKGMLKYSFFTRPMLDFLLDLPDLRQWRREGLAVELRMVRVDCEKVNQAWPNSLKLLANGNEILDVKPPEEGHKRRDVPQNISPGLRPGPNSLCVKMVDDRHSDFALAVVLTSPRGNPELSAQVPLCPESSARSRVRRLLARHQPDGDQGEDVVCLTSDTLKLRCPITMERVEDPVRGEHCQHLQCFGLEAYLTSNRQMRAFNNRWQCPVCTLVLRPMDLCRDPYVARVLQSAGDDAEEVIVSADGAWRCPGTPSLSLPAQLPAPAAQQQATQALDLDPDAAPAPLGSPAPAPRKRARNASRAAVGKPPPRAPSRRSAATAMPAAGPAADAALEPSGMEPAGAAAAEAAPEPASAEALAAAPAPDGEGRAAAAQAAAPEVRSAVSSAADLQGGPAAPMESTVPPATPASAAPAAPVWPRAVTAAAQEPWLGLPTWPRADRVPAGLLQHLPHATRMGPAWPVPGKKRPRMTPSAQEARQQLAAPPSPSGAAPLPGALPPEAAAAGATAALQEAPPRRRTDLDESSGAH
mmetsp:Transcript_25215/g.80113  ORF Transcript_25215/g.80113 Transcript_25215/m.80113 type:complete len:703 (+) Transcript_25215:127-2235(+)